jgi:hypothetical protein
MVETRSSSAVEKDEPFIPDETSLLIFVISDYSKQIAPRENELLEFANKEYLAYTIE